MIGDNIGQAIWDSFKKQYGTKALLCFGIVMFGLAIAVAVGVFG